MGYLIGFIMIVIIFSLLKDRNSTKQPDFKKTNSTASKGMFNYYGDSEDTDDKWGNDSGYSGGWSDGGSDGGGGGGGGGD